MPKLKYDWDTAWLLFAAGADHATISKTLSIPIGTVQQYSANKLWSQRRALATRKAKGARINAIAKRIEEGRERHQNFMLDQIEENEVHIDRLEVGDDRDNGEVSIGAKMNLLEQHDRIARKTLDMDKDNTMDPLAQGFALLASLSKGAHLKNLVNESIEADFEDIESEEVNGKLTPSAYLPLPDKTNASLGILRSKNAHPDSSETTEITPDTHAQGQESQETEAEPIEGENGANPHPQPISEQPGDRTATGDSHIGDKLPIRLHFK